MSLQKETVKEVPIEKLSVEQLNYVGQQIEKEIKNYSQYYSSLRAVNNKYLDNKEYIKQLKEYKDKEILVPMTSSLYIPGKCADVKKLTIEIGANFFVETTIEKAEKFCDRKIENLKKSDYHPDGEPGRYSRRNAPLHRHNSTPRQSPDCPQRYGSHGRVAVHWSGPDTRYCSVQATNLKAVHGPMPTASAG